MALKGKKKRKRESDSSDDSDEEDSDEPDDSDDSDDSDRRKKPPLQKRRKKGAGKTDEVRPACKGYIVVIQFYRCGMVFSVP